MKNQILFIFFIAIALLSSLSVSAQNLNVTLTDTRTYSGQTLSNIWGWKDPQDGKEYALVGAENGLSIVDVTNPANVFEVVQVPGPSCTWREIKTVGNYAYVTTECGSIGLQIVDLTNLPATNLQTATWTPTIGNTKLATIHALHADNGKIYLYGSNVGNGGCIIADVSSTPMAPVYLGSYDPRYVHDGYVRNDTLYAAHIYDGECAVVNLANPSNPQILDVFTTPTNFTHNTWLSKDSKYCFTTDENNNSYLAAFDVSTIGNIFEVDRIQSNPGSNSIVHNTHIINVNGNDFAVTSWYKDGFTIVDVGRPHNLVQVGNYDTAPTASGPGMQNCWGVHPFLPSGTIVASDISNGLFVLSPNYVRACYIEGVVTDCFTGSPLSGVTVQITNPGPNTNSATDITDAMGQYGVGVVNAGTYTVTFSKSGYNAQSFVVSVSNGNVTFQNVQLCGPTPPFVYTGAVCDNFSQQGIPNANVKISDGTNTWDVLTNANGNFTISNMIPGVYQITVGKWGYVTTCVQNQNINLTSGSLSICIVPGIYDDFTWDWNWTESGTSTAGDWVRGVPKGTTCNGFPANPGTDVASDCSDQAYVTGNAGNSCTDDDVDGGHTNLSSPNFDLSGYQQPWLFYDRWHYFSSSQQNDSLKIYIENGNTSYLLEELSNSSPNKGMWVSRSYNLSGLIPFTSTMKIRVRARDAGSGHVVECGFDKFYVVDSSVTSTQSSATNIRLPYVYPNPFSNGIFFLNNSVSADQINVYDVFGKLILERKIPYGIVPININNAVVGGIYYYLLTKSGEKVGGGKIIREE